MKFESTSTELQRIVDIVYWKAYGKWVDFRIEIEPTCNPRSYVSTRSIGQTVGVTTHSILFNQLQTIKNGHDDSTRHF